MAEIRAVRKVLARLVIVALLAATFATVGTAPPADATTGPPGLVDTMRPADGFGNPSDVAVNPSNGDIYVADSTGHQLVRFDANGDFQSLFRPSGGGAITPKSIVIASPYAYFTTGENVNIYDTTSGLGGVLFHGAWIGSVYGIATDDAANFYVTSHHQVWKYNVNRQLLTAWGSQGTGVSQFSNALGVDVGPDGSVYVVDSGNNRVQKFTADGGYLGQWGGAGSSNAQFHTPIDVAVDDDNNVYVSDMENQRIQQFKPDGTYVTQWGTHGSGPNQLNFPAGVGVDDGGDVYVADQDNGRVQRFGGGRPGLTVEKTADQTSVSNGDPIDYHVRVTNSGATPLTGVTVSDPNAPDCDATVGDLAVGAHETIDCSYTTEADDTGTYANTATADSAETEPATSNTVDVTVAAPTAGIAGTVTESGSGDPVPKAFVAVLRASDLSVAANPVADNDGNYRIEGLEPGDYYLYLLDPAGAHTNGFHGDPTRVTVTEDHVTDLDPVMAPTLGALSGQVIDDDTGQPVSGAWVVAIGDQGTIGTATAADGTYAIEGLRIGSYRVTFVHAGHVQEYWDDSLTYSGGDVIAITAGAPTTANAALAPATSAAPAP